MQTASEILKRVGLIFKALRECWRGAAGTYAYDAHLQHTHKCNARPLTAQQFYLDDIQRKYSRPNRCC